MTRKLVQTGSSLAVTLPKEVVDQFKLKKGDPVEVSVHPQTGAIVVRTAVRYVEGGKLTKRFNERAQKVLSKYDKAFEALAK
jgi:putative addiction module antidote